MVMKDLNMFTILELLIKIKATLSVLVGNDPELLLKIQKLYIQNATIILDDKEQKCADALKSEFQEFMEKDEKFDLI